MLCSFYSPPHSRITSGSCSQRLQAHTECCESIPASLYTDYSRGGASYCFRQADVRFNIFPFLCMNCAIFYVNLNLDMIPSYSHFGHLCMHKCISTFVAPPHTHTYKHTPPGIVTQLNPAAVVYILWGVDCWHSSWLSMVNQQQSGLRDQW